MTKTQIILTVVGLCVTAIGIIIPLIIGVYSLKKRFSWDKAMLAYELGRVWTEKTLVHRKVIEKKYGMYFVASRPIVPPQCEIFANANEGDELFEAKIAVVSLMNYLEDIAVLYTSGMADKRIIDSTLRRPVLRYYDKIRPLAKCIDDIAGYPSWHPLDDLVTRWKQEEAASTSLRSRKFP